MIRVFVPIVNVTSHLMLAVGAAANVAVVLLLLRVLLQHANNAMLLSCALLVAGHAMRAPTLRQPLRVLLHVCTTDERHLYLESALPNAIRIK